MWLNRMKLTTLFALAWGAILPLAGLAAAPDLAADLLPRPSHILPRAGQYDFTARSLAFELHCPGDAAPRLSAHFREFIAPLGLGATLKTAPAPGGETFALTTAPVTDPAGLAAPAELGAQGYRLVIAPQGIRITARTEPGLFYGMMTLEQLVQAARARGLGALPAMVIDDKPALAMRGYHEDYGRDQLPTMDDHKRSIRTLARYKMNTYLWFIEPDHFVYRFDPNLSTDYDRFRFEEIRELVAYARQYYIEVIPVVELLGHMEMTLRHDRYKGLAELPAGGSDLCPTSDESFRLAKNIIAEVAPAFGGRYFHAGLDESFGIGQGNSARAVKEKGIERVYADYYNRLNREIRAQGQTMMMYVDIVLNHPNILNLLDRDIVLMFWDYSPEFNNAGLNRIKATGQPFVAISGMWDWCNLYPFYPAGFKNIEGLAGKIAEAGGMGCFVTDWGDGYKGVSGTNLSELTNYGVVYSGAMTWNPKPIAMAEYSRQFALQFFGSPAPELARALTDLATAQGDTLAHVTQARKTLFDDPRATVLTMAGASEADLAFWRTLKERADRAHAALAQLNPPRNADYLRVTDLAARMLAASADLALLCREINERLPRDPAQGFAPDVAESFAAKVEALARRHRALKADYRAAWLATNRPLNLVHIERQWDGELNDLAAFAADLRRGDFPPRYVKGARLAFDFGAENPMRARLGEGLEFRPVEGKPAPSLARDAGTTPSTFLRLTPGTPGRTVDTKRLADFEMTPFLVEAWVRNPGQPEQQYGSTIVSFGEGGHGWRLGLNKDHQVHFTLYGVQDLAGPHSLVPPDGRWHHVAVNFVGCRAAIYFVDGKKTDELPLPGYPASPSTPWLLVGNELNLVTPFTGDLAAFRVSAGVYSEAEVRALAARTSFTDRATSAPARNPGE